MSKFAHYMRLEYGDMYVITGIAGEEKFGASVSLADYKKPPIKLEKSRLGKKNMHFWKKLCKCAEILDLCVDVSVDSEFLAGYDLVLRGELRGWKLIRVMIVSSQVYLCFIKPGSETLVGREPCEMIALHPLHNLSFRFIVEEDTGSVFEHIIYFHKKQRRIEYFRKMLKFRPE